MGVLRLEGPRFLALALLILLPACGDRSRPQGSADTGATPPTDSAAAPAPAPDTAATSTRDSAPAADTTAGEPAPARAAPAAPDTGAKRAVTKPKPAHDSATAVAAKPAPNPKPDTTAAPPAPTADTARAAAPAAAPLRDAYHQAPRDTVTQAVYDGWKQFNLNCARCHGEDVTGTTIAPHLIVSLKPDGPINSKEIFVQTVCAGRPAKGMPAWCSLGLEMDKINNIYSYVKGRSDGKIGPGRPAVREQG
jgi:hypothetical protein